MERAKAPVGSVARRRWHLSGFLVGLSLSALLPAIAVGCFATWHAVKGYRTAAEERLRDNATALGAAVDREIAGATAMLAAFATSPALTTAGADADWSIADVQARKIAAMMGAPVLVGRRDGTQILNTQRPFGTPLPPVNSRELVAHVMDSGLPAVGDVVKGSVNAGYVFPIAVPVRDGAGEVSLFAAAIIKTQRVRELLAAETPSGTFFSIVTDSKGSIVAQSDADSGPFAGELISSAARQAQASGTLDLFYGGEADGTRRAYAGHSLRLVSGWTLTVVQPVSGMSATWQEPFLVLAGGGVAAIILGGIAALFAARQILQPIRRLGAHARSLAMAEGASGPATAAALPPASIIKLEQLRHDSATAEVALRESETQIRRVLDSLFAFVGVLSLDGTLLEANRAPLEAAGLAMEDVQGRPFWECFWWTHDSAEVSRVRDACRRAAAGEASRYDAVVRMAGDSRMTIDFQITPLRDGEGRITHLVPSAVDVTEQRRTEAALRDSEARFRLVAENMSEGLLIFDPQGNPVYQNRASLRIHGFGRTEGGEIAREGLAKTWHGWDAEGRPLAFENWPISRVLRGERIEGQVLRAARDGAGPYFYGSYNGSPIHDPDGTLRLGFITIREITAETEARGAVAESEERLRLALDAADLGTWRWEVAEGTSGFAWDARCKALFGLPPEAEVDYVTWAAALLEEDRGATEAAVARALDPGDPDDAVGMDYRVRLPDGQLRWLAVRGRAIFTADHAAPAGRRAMRILGTIRDATDTREAAAALARSNEEARAAAERVQLALAAGAIVGTWDWDLTTDRFTVDERFATYFGIDPALGRSGLSLEQVIATVYADDLPGLRAAIAEAIGRGGPYSHEYRVRGLDGVFRWIEANGRVDLAEDGTPLRFPGVLLDVEARRALEAERDRTATLLRTVLEAVPAVVYAKDRDGRMLAANEGTAALVGKPIKAILGLTDAEFLDDPAQAAAVIANDRRIMEVGAVEQVEEVVSLPDGTPVVWLSTKAPFRDAAGQVMGLVGASVDISDRKRAEERLRLMVNELNHRVKNTLATVQSIAAQSLRGADPAMRRALDARLMALATAHDVLTREGWAGANMDDVVAGVLAPYGGREGDRFRVAGPSLRLVPRAAVALSMGLHELLTNALKYGALSVEGGNIILNWDIRTGGEPFFNLIWTEQGGPPVSPPARHGFGTRLLERTLAQDLGGTARLEFVPEGVVCRVEAPLAQIAARAEVAPLPRLGDGRRDG